MNHRVYLLITVLFVVLTLNLSEARIMSSNSGKTIGPPSWSLSAPVKNNPSIAQRMANKYDDDFQALKKTKSKDQSTTGSSKIPKKDSTQTPGRKKGDRPGSVTIVK